MVQPGSRKLLGQVDAVVFDCDGVLIDVRRSYDSAILRTAATMVEGFTGVRLPLDSAGQELIVRIRRTGGFNDDWDTTYAITLFSFLSLEETPGREKLSARQLSDTLRRLSERVADFASRNRLEGRASVDAYLRRRRLESDRVQELRRYLDYPTDDAHNRMTRVFDEMYYGGKLFQKVYGVEPAHWIGEGLIEQERVMITRSQMDRLQRRLGGNRVAMSTGRPFVAVQYTLGGLLKYFDREASVYIGDGEVNPKLAKRLRKFRKPSGASLVRAYEKLPSKMLLYVGDSAEDLLMVRNARKTYEDVLFLGIYGTSYNEEEQVAYFTRNGSDAVTRTVENVPVILERTRE